LPHTLIISSNRNIDSVKAALSFWHVQAVPSCLISASFLTGATMSTPPPQQRVSLPVDNAVEELLLWRNPVRSGLALGTATVAYILLVWSHRSLISLVSMLAAIVVATCFVWSSLAGYLNRPGPPVPRLLKEGISEGQAKQLVDSYVPMVNRALALLYRICTGRDPILAGEVVVSLIVISKLGKIFSVLTWAYLAVLVAFVAPKLYELKKPEIDDALTTGQARTKQLYDTHVAPQVAKIPRASSATPARGSRPGPDSGYVGGSTLKQA
jgi:riboflavin kinase